MFSNLQKFAAKFRAPSQHELEMRYLTDSTYLYSFVYRCRNIDTARHRAPISYYTFPHEIRLGRLISGPFSIR